MFLKSIIKYMGLFVLIVFSFFYSDRVASVISSKDSLMIKLNDIKSNYEVKATDGIISGNTFIPGISGRAVNVDKSYKKMKEYGSFSDELIVYDYVKPINSLVDNVDKYIIHGNYSKKMVSLLFVVDSSNYLDKLESVISGKDVVLNYFVTFDFLMNNSTYISSLKNVEVYNYGDNGSYSPDNLIFANNLITRITSNEAIYCLSNGFNESVISLCSKNNLYTVVPSVVISSNFYSSIKKGIDNGSIVLVKLNNNNIMELSIVVDYIRGKGLEIVGLSNLLSE